jgi:hypothetical protein
LRAYFQTPSSQSHNFIRTAFRPFPTAICNCAVKPNLSCLLSSSTTSFVTFATVAKVFRHALLSARHGCQQVSPFLRPFSLSRQFQVRFSMRWIVRNHSAIATYYPLFPHFSVDNSALNQNGFLDQSMVLHTSASRRIPFYVFAM